jgi:hypothetical protein
MGGRAPDQQGKKAIADIIDDKPGDFVKVVASLPPSRRYMSSQTTN